MEKKTFDVIAAGHICFDVIPKFFDTGERDLGKILVPGKLVNVAKAALSTGGPVSNTGIALQILDNKVSFIARIGDDDFGKLVIERLKKFGNIKGIKVSKGDTTSYTVALSAPGIDRIFLHCPGANDNFLAGDIDYALVKKSKLFHLGYPPLMKSMYSNTGKEFVDIYKKAKKTGVTTSLDMSLPDPNSPSGKVDWKTILSDLFPHLDIALPSIEEMFFMLEKDEYLKLRQANPGKDLIGFVPPAVYSRLSETMLKLGTKIAVLKTGHRGYYIRTADESKLKSMGALPPKDISNWANRELWCPAFVIKEIASATGSGDSSIAGFLSAYLRGYSIEETLKYANCLGFQNLHTLDALSGIKTWSETVKLVNSDMPMIDPDLKTAAGWKYDSKFKLWTGPNDRKK
jgi:sugar/nucleoside kinase (ribokinase family)